MPEQSFFDSPQDRETLAKLATAVDRAYNRTGSMIWRSFLQGFVSALGAAAGTLVILLIAFYVLKQVGGGEILQNWIKGISSSIAQSQEQTLLQNFHQ